MRAHLDLSAVGGTLFLLLLSVPAQAQWYVGTYTGGNVTQSSTVTIDQPGFDRVLDFADVTFDARPLESPQYYGARIGRMLGAGRFGIEVEFLHVKAIARTDRIVRVTGRDLGVAIDANLRMDQYVQRHAMSHGLNFWLANVVWRVPVGSVSTRAPVAMVFRAGAGPVVPGVDSVVGHVSVQDYQYSGLGGQLSAGLDIRLRGRLSALVEYKFTGTRPRLDIDAGTAVVTALTHHVVAGFAFGFSR